jgi:hypothetical protein
MTANGIADAVRRRGAQAGVDRRVTALMPKAKLRTAFAARISRPFR